MADQPINSGTSDDATSSSGNKTLTTSQLSTDQSSQIAGNDGQASVAAVSYTHLTLPTILRV